MHGERCTEGVWSTEQLAQHMQGSMVQRQFIGFSGSRKTFTDGLTSWDPWNLSASRN